MNPTSEPASGRMPAFLVLLWALAGLAGVALQVFGDGTLDTVGQFLSGAFWLTWLAVMWSSGQLRDWLARLRSRPN